jgi:hypothetical protein
MNDELSDLAQLSSALHNTKQPNTIGRVAKQNKKLYRYALK